jgi:hypothetical protein
VAQAASVAMTIPAQAKRIMCIESLHESSKIKTNVTECADYPVSAVLLSSPIIVQRQ